MAEDVFGIVGTTVAGNFHVERVVAEGGFGVVYRAQHGGFHAPVAIKVLKIPATLTPEQRDAFLAKFSEEAEVLFRLSAMIPEVVRPLHVDVIQQPDGKVAPFLALEWLEGEPFDQVLARRCGAGKLMGMHKLVKTLAPIARALARAHRFPGPDGPVSIVHSDLKPENIFMSVANGVEKVKILDFGIARSKSVATQMAGRVTSGEGLNAFTPGYGAPEQWVPKRYGQTGPWTDVWGLALTMVEALCGYPPIDGEIAAMMGTALDPNRRPTPRAEGVSVSDDVEQIFERALAVDPRDRTKDIETFWCGLEAALGMPSSFVLRDGRRDATRSMPSEPPAVPTLVGGASAPSARPAAVPLPASPPSPVEIPALELGPAPSRPPSSPRVGDRALGSARTAETPSRLPNLGSASGQIPYIPTLATGAASVSPSSAAHGQRAAPDAFDDLEPFSPELDPARNNSAFEVGRSPSRSQASGLVAVPVDAASASRRRSTPSRQYEPHPVAANAGLADLRERLRAPLVVVGVAALIAVVDVVAANVQGELLRILGLRPLWIAAPLAVVGVAVAFWRLLGEHEG